MVSTLLFEAGEGDFGRCTTAEKNCACACVPSILRLLELQRVSQR